MNLYCSSQSILFFTLPDLELVLGSLPYLETVGLKHGLADPHQLAEFLGTVLGTQVHLERPTAKQSPFIIILLLYPCFSEPVRFK